jgi:hypothetical protein
MAVRILRRAFDVDEYHRMAEAGILSEDDRVELLEPTHNAYATVAAARGGQTVGSRTTPGLSLAPDDILG